MAIRRLIIIRAIGSSVAILLLLSTNSFAQNRETIQSSTGSGKQKYTTFAYDNCRFFSPRSQGGESWFDVTVKGKREWLASIDARRCALVVVDMQPGCLGWSALPGDLGKFHKERTEKIVIPNLVRLVEFFRKNDLIIVYLTLGNDQPIPEIAMSEERAEKKKEFLIAKFSSGAFATCALDNVLRENGIQTVFFVGTDTAGCVDATIHEAYDRTYQTILIEDGCMSARQELHEAAVKIWAYKGYVRSTDQVINDYPWQKWVHPEVVD